MRKIYFVGLAGAVLFGGLGLSLPAAADPWGLGRTCPNVIINGPYVTADCYNAFGGLSHSSIDSRVCKNVGLGNANGQLSCAGPAQNPSAQNSYGNPGANGRAPAAPQRDWGAENRANQARGQGGGQARGYSDYQGQGYRGQDYRGQGYPGQAYQGRAYREGRDYEERGDRDWDRDRDWDGPRRRPDWN